MACASCTHGFCDKEPDFDENMKKNRQITKEFIETKKHMEEYENGDRSDPPTDEAGNRIKKISNPTLLPILLRCPLLDELPLTSERGKKVPFWV